MAGVLTARAGANATRPSTLTSTRVLVNTGITLIQAANDEEGGGAWVSVPGVPKSQGLTKRDFLTSYFPRAFTLVLLCPS